MAYTYILECGDGTLYTGWTNDPEKRLAAHNAGTGAKQSFLWDRKLSIIKLQKKIYFKK